MNSPELPPVSIVIPTLNEERHLPILLASLRPIEAPHEIIVVDGHSDDRTKAIVEHAPQDMPIRLIESPARNAGAQRNMGAKQARYNILMFLDADVIIPTKSVFDDLVSEFIDRDLIAANAQFISHPHEERFMTRLVFLAAWIMQRVGLFIGRPFFAGACIVTRRDVFLRLGGFDESMMLAEDTEYARRAHTYGRCGLLSGKVSTSMRRLDNLTLRQAWEYTKIVPYFLATGRVPDRLAKHYRFGQH